MTKHVLCLLSILLAGCSSQQKSVFIANFENVCGYTVEVSTHDYSNGKGSFPAGQQLAADDSIEVLSYIVFNETLEDSVPGTYRLDIAAHGKSVSLDKQRLLAHLKRSPIEQKGNAITIWTINDTSLCP